MILQACIFESVSMQVEQAIRAIWAADAGGGQSKN
jgi:hypothetical protein